MVSALLFFFVAGAAAETVRVAKVVDGDSLRLADGREIRLIGVNAPELGRDDRPAEPLAREARTLLANLLVGGRITLTLDAERRDRYGRLLAHVSLPDGRNVQELLLRQGLAFLVAQPPNLARLPAYQAAEEEAVRLRRGVWRHAYYAPVAAEQISSRHTGFRLVTGTVRRVTQNTHMIYLELTPAFALTVPRENRRYFPGRPEDLAGRRVLARGWVTARDGRLQLRLPHPAMLTFVE
jgi:endonuclease YncB( thermonuclease family)